MGETKRSLLAARISTVGLGGPENWKLKENEDSSVSWVG